MKNNLKMLILATSLLFLTPSCSMYREAGTFEPCIPREKEDTTIKQKMINYISEPDGTYSLKSKINSYLKEEQLRLRREIKF